jgi:hypothetical protein
MKAENKEKVLARGYVWEDHFKRKGGFRVWKKRVEPSAEKACGVSMVRVKVVEE